MFHFVTLWRSCVPFCYTVAFHFVTGVSFLSFLYAHFMLDLCLVLCYNILIKLNMVGSVGFWFMGFMALRR